MDGVADAEGARGLWDIVEVVGNPVSGGGCFPRCIKKPITFLDFVQSTDIHQKISTI